MYINVLVTLIIISIFIICLFMGFLLSKDIKNSKIRENKLKETEQYLKTVYKRIELTNSKEALILLWEEMKNKSKVLTFNDSTSSIWIKYSWYLLGKAEGIHSTKIKNKKISL